MKKKLEMMITWVISVVYSQVRNILTYSKLCYRIDKCCCCGFWMLNLTWISNDYYLGDRYFSFNYIISLFLYHCILQVEKFYRFQMYLLDLSILVEALPQDGCDLMYEDNSTTSSPVLPVTESVKVFYK